MNNQLTLFDRDSDYLESSVKDFDSKTASFRVHASLIYKLGESLIADEITALSELIKNAYDADATVCALSISSDYIEEIDGKECTGCIELSDNGCGMDLTTIVNGWLTLSNSPKKKMKKEQKTTPKYHRYPLGDKGLGRLSVQKIGRYMQMTTKAADSNIEYRVIIPWGDFLKNSRDFDLRLNRGMLNQVFDNLFSNAEYWLDYSAQQGLIENKQYHISAIERGIIVVWDNGIGISPDLETRLFDPFETKKKDGRGLGLYIAAGNLKYSSSRIRLLNERNRFGNLFKFEIDVSQAMQ